MARRAVSAEHLAIAAHWALVRLPSVRVEHAFEQQGLPGVHGRAGPALPKPGFDLMLNPGQHGDSETGSCGD